jgi:hypothetical protein
MAGLDNVELWRIIFCGPKLEKRIKTEALYFNGFAVSVAILSYVNAVMHSKSLENHEDIFYPLAIFKEFVPQWQNVLSALYRATFFSDTTHTNNTLLHPYIRHQSFTISVLYVAPLPEEHQQRIRNNGTKSIGRQSSLPERNNKEIEILHSTLQYSLYVRISLQLIYI